MENQEKNEVLSRAVKAGKRTYFFDVKSNEETGTFFYEKHKIFLYKEDFEKFQNALSGVIEFIQTGKVPEETMFEPNTRDDDGRVDVDFDNLDMTL